MDKSVEEPTIICLPSSKLLVRGGCLVKESWENQTISRHELATIGGVELRRGISISALLLFPSALVAALAGAVMLSSPVWSIVVVILSLLVALISFFSIKTVRLVVKTGDGVVEYELSDNQDSIQGFTVSLSALIKGFAASKCQSEPND